MCILRFETESQNCDLGLFSFETAPQNCDVCIFRFETESQNCDVVILRFENESQKGNMIILRFGSDSNHVDVSIVRVESLFRNRSENTFQFEVASQHCDMGICDLKQNCKLRYMHMATKNKTATL